MVFSTANRHTSLRVQTLFEKEPDTIDWIRGMGTQDILFGVGADVGMYSALAAAKGVPVFAFKRESQSYAILNRNIGFKQAFTAPYLPNSLFLFFKTDTALHGVPPINGRVVERNLLLYNVCMRKIIGTQPDARETAWSLFRRRTPRASVAT